MKFSFSLISQQCEQHWFQEFTPNFQLYSNFNKIPRRYKDLTNGGKQSILYQLRKRKFKLENFSVGKLLKKLNHIVLRSYFCNDDRIPQYMEFSGNGTSDWSISGFTTLT